MSDHLDFVAYFSKRQANVIGIPTSQVIHLDPQVKKWHVNKGPFVHAKSKEVFEKVIHRRLIQAFDSHPDTVNGWIKYVNQSLPAGIDLIATRFEFKNFGFEKDLIAPTPPESNNTQLDGIEVEMNAYLKKFGEKIN
jgi:ribosomal protein S10